MRWSFAGLVLIAGALGAALAPPPATWVEAVYAGRIYPALQVRLSAFSNLTRLPLFDLMLVSLLPAGLIAGGLALRRAWRTRALRPAGRALFAGLSALAIFYLWFLGAWGLNYRRLPVESAIADVQPSRVTSLAVRLLAERAVTEANRLHAPAHAHGFPAIDAVPQALLQSLHTVERQLGRPRSTLPTNPKRPWTAIYMRAVGVSGMLAPFFLETYLNPDLTGPERPYVLAHEWAHLSGYAPEDEASFVGMVAALGADVASQYSAWLALVFDTAAQLEPATRQVVLEPLAEGPRRDQEAIVARLRQRVEVIDRASWVAYDRAIKSQGAVHGVQGYGRVVELLISTGVIERGGLQ
jgi:hypothetical protein